MARAKAIPQEADQKTDEPIKEEAKVEQQQNITKAVKRYTLPDGTIVEDF